MPIRGFRVLAWLLPVLTATNGLAFEAERYRAVEEHGAWSLLCDYEADMGHTTYFACAVQSTAPVPMLFDGVGTDGVTAYVAAGFGGTAVTAPGVAIDLPPCDAADWCAIPGDDGANLLAAAAAGQPVLITGDVGLRRVPAGGLDAAIAAAEALID